jgi:hypothetical protein
MNKGYNQFSTNKLTEFRRPPQVKSSKAQILTKFHKIPEIQFEVLRLMRTDSTKGVQSWLIKVPPRPILGATPENAQIYLTAMAHQDALQQIKRK